MDDRTDYVAPPNHPKDPVDLTIRPVRGTEYTDFQVLIKVVTDGCGRLIALNEDDDFIAEITIIESDDDRSATPYVALMRRAIRALDEEERHADR